MYLYFQGEDVSRTRQWFKALQFYGLSLGNWRRRRNGMANIMIYGTSSTNASKTMSSPMTNTEASKSTSALFVPKSSSLSQLVDLSPWSCGYEMMINSLLDNAPNCVVGCIIQKRMMMYLYYLYSFSKWIIFPAVKQTVIHTHNKKKLISSIKHLDTFNHYI